MDDGAITGRAMRSDALARRAALIEAARICFARSGYFVPLEEIADAAGVGRGTFYRNFRDRMALALAVFDHEVDRLVPLIDPSLPFDRALARLVTRGSGATALFARLAFDMPMDGENRTAFEGLRARLETLLRPLVERGHRDGALAEGLGAREVVLALRMIGGLLLPHLDEAERQAQVEEALAVVLTGLAPR